jgi:multicomponent Na+:H+ antiporter subunit B
VILKTCARFLVVLIAFLSLFVLFRGHNEPGGGFIGGLLMASAFLIYGMAYGPKAARALFRIEPRTLTGVGLAVALLAGCLALLAGRPFLTGLWLDGQIPGIGKLSSVLLFDVGVYLVVTGTALHILLSVAEED